MAVRYSHEGEPHLIYSLAEWRALLEMATLPYALPALLAKAPSGDGHPVLLLPGFMANEGTLFALKMFIGHRGYAVQTWGFGRNVGFHRRHAQALEQKVRYLHHQSGRKLSLVGWSLGGLFAVYAAHQAPECVRSVITLGSPISIDANGSRSAPMVRALYRLISHPMGVHAHAMSPRTRKLREQRPPPVPTTCLYSLGDGVVPPQEATISGDPRMHENVRVAGSHTGMGFNPMVMAIVADRLAQPEGQWRPFRPEGASGRLYRLLTRAAAAA